MNRTLKEATVYRNYYDTHQQLREHLSTFLLAYNFAKRLKTLYGLTPYEYICQQWQQHPERFLRDPSHHTLGLYILATDDVVYLPGTNFAADGVSGRNLMRLYYGYCTPVQIREGIAALARGLRREGMLA